MALQGAEGSSSSSSSSSDLDGFSIDESTYLEVKEPLRLAKVPRKEISLENFDGKVSLLGDLMEKRDVKGKRHEFLSIFLCVIDETWAYKKWAIKCCSIDEKFGAKRLMGIVEFLNEEWDDIKENVCSLTLNSDYGFPEFDFVRHRVNKKKLLLNGQLFRVYCAAECINLVVQSLFDEIGSITFKIRDLCPAREPALWYLENSNLKRALDMWSKGKFDSKAAKKNSEVPSAEEWDRVKAVCETVDKIHNVAKGLFHREDVTSNLFLYSLDEIRAILTQHSVGSSEAGLSKLNAYWKRMFLVLTVSAVLDPRFKMKYVKFSCYKFCGNDEPSSTLRVKTVLDAIRSLYDDYAIRFPRKTSAPSGSTSTELDKYLEEAVVPWSDDFKVLSWWKRASSGGEYPILSRIARDILAIPMSLATWDEAFYAFQPRQIDERLEPILRAGASTALIDRMFKKG